MNQLFPLPVAVPLMTAAALLAFRSLLRGRQVRGVVAVATSASVGPPNDVTGPRRMSCICLPGSHYAPRPQHKPGSAGRARS